MHAVELDERVYHPIHKVLEDINISEKEALIEFSLITAMSKLSGFEEECHNLRERYGMNFKEFENKVMKAKKENFREWDDYTEWKFVETGREHWAKRVKELKDALRSF